MKFGQTFTNKLVSYTDRYFTYDTHKLKREGDDTNSFEYIAHNYDSHTSVFIARTEHGLYIVIKRDGIYIRRGFLKTYKDVDAFRRMIRCLG